MNGNMAQSYRILLAEDDENIRNVVSDALEMAGYSVIACEDGAVACRAIQSGGAFDLALLDVGMPGADGFEVLALMGRECPGVPAIMLTARSDEEDRIRGLKLGADDYVVKPFSIRELLARIEAVLRRSPERPKAVREVTVPHARLNAVRKAVEFDDGTEAVLTSREYDLLVYLGTHEGRLVSRDELLRRVWDMDPRLVETKSVEMTIVRLRSKLGQAAGCLETVRGQGYCWKTGRGE